MNVTCTQCGKAYRLPPGTLKEGVVVQIKCKVCQTVFTVGSAAKSAEDKFAEALAEIPNALPPADAPIGEVTRSFIAASGADRRNPPWKIALFVVVGLGLPVSALYLLSMFHVVPLEVTRTNEQGETVTQSVFSAEGVSGLKDLLTGAEAERREAAQRLKVDRMKQVAALERAKATAAANAGGLDSPERKGGSTGELETGALSPSALAAFYEEGHEGKREVAPKLRGADAPAVAHAGGLDDGAAAKVVVQSQPAFQGCIEDALRRTPNMRVGKVTLLVTVGASGSVKSATVNPKQHATSDWAQCLVQRAKRMVFPPFEGDDEAELQVPLVVGVSI